MARRWTSAILGLVVAGAGAAGVVASSSSDPPEDRDRRASGFEPKSLKGKWTGEWENLTFGSQGDILANVQFKDGKFIPLVDFSGNVLGCPDPPADTVTLKEGERKNKWNEDGFKVVTESEAFGDLKFVYKREGNDVSASGNSPCNPSTTFELDGKLTGSKFSGAVDIDFASGPDAKAELSAEEE